MISITDISIFIERLEDELDGKTKDFEAALLIFLGVLKLTGLITNTEVIELLESYSIY